MKISTNKTLHFAGLAGLLTMVGLPALAQSETETAEASQTESSTTSDLEQNADSTILKDIHNINLAEIKMAGFAEKHAANREVKSFAQRLVRDHKASETAIVPVAKDANVTLTEGLNVLTVSTTDQNNWIVWIYYSRHFRNQVAQVLALCGLIWQRVQFHSMIGRTSIPPSLAGGMREAS